MTRNIHIEPDSDFICEKCGIYLHQTEQVVYVDNNRVFDSFDFQYCPNCGEEIEMPKLN